MPQPTAPARHILVLGGGALAAELYAPAVVRLGWEREMLFVDVSQRSIDTLARAFPTLRTRVAGYADLIRDPEFVKDFGGVVIALPNYLHEHAVTVCLEAGLDVLCEKPLALDAKTCRQLADVAERNGRHLSIAMVRRLIPGVIAVKDALRSGLVGDLVQLEIQHGSRFQWPSDSGAYFRPENGGLLVNMGVHYLDMIEDWVGPITPVTYRDDFAGGAEANCDYTLATAAGAGVRLKLSVTDKLENFVFIKGSRGEIRMDVNKFDSFSWQGSQPDLTGDLHPRQPFTCEAWPLDFVSSFAQQFVEFQAVIEHNEAERVSARQAAHTHELIDWAYANRESLLPRICRPGPRPELEPGKATVTGGSGFVGDNLVERLHQLGFDDIVVPVRSFRSGARVARTRVERRLTNLLNYDSVAQSIAGSRYVFHLAHGGDASDSARVTVEGTKNVVEAAIAHQVEVVVVVSTATVFGNPKTDRPVDETFPYLPALGAYGRNKVKAEEYCLARAKTSGSTRIVVINPGSIYGPCGRLFTSLPARAVREGYFGWIDDGSGRVNYTFVENVVDALILAASSPRAHGQNFIISDGACSFREFLGPMLGSVADKIPSYTRQQALALEKAARPGFRDLIRALTGPDVMRVVNGLPLFSAPKKFIEKRFGGAYKKAQRARATLHSDKVEQSDRGVGGPPPSWMVDIFGPSTTEYSSAKAREILGWAPLVPLDEGVRACRWWLGTVGMLEPGESSPETAAVELHTR
ncbi:MAG: NAD-dependent epimerase/dehydratase family protein [Acidobacteriota bacterium]|nr:NAD-dependent epimerase/dehydratase family protein [Acidobacteriota bacterium]